MSGSNRNSKVFLCCFCGILIKSNRANLTRHEQIHEKNVKRVKCVHCEVTFHNKTNYWSHWKQTHRDRIMPDSLCYVLEQPKPRRKAIKNTSEILSERAKKPIDSEISNAVNLAEKTELKIEDMISRCLKRYPFFGEMKFEEDGTKPI